ncbi:bifunctional isocitrate dehydrogenase kinase/phosphatase [Porticoccaceae bacterium]|nr:bifunctional isocitrate dehydrogenase kinase/phosphatase [Porticoccaceae bacterium]MDA8652208.1 bifunctional isocitrate dehydrogenase kinase/phosphatase [Porticoccaceae bacterium]MDA8682230.1 bifunctional isocitrate dehydrogenase kinase/phosphatase [Porticoccaceae bacterium]
MALQPLIHNSTARRMAKTILNGFRSYFADYLNSTLTAKARYEKADWHGVREANVERLELYKTKVAQTVQYLGVVTNKDIASLTLWQEAKKAYTQLVFNFPNFEIAETFFNSVFSDIHDHDKISDDIIYVLSSQLIEAPEAEYSVFVRYQGTDFRTTFERILKEAEFSLPMEDLDTDLDCIMDVFQQDVAPHIKGAAEDVRFDLLESTFYRSKAAYMVGRVRDGDQTFPMALVILNNEQGALYVDTALFDADELSVIFSFTRNHFMVDAPLPYQYAHFLKSLMPNKLDYEIYNSLGFPKHAKTEFYRQLVGHLDQSDDEFIVAPGIKGMVMTVFTLPSYNIVFKIIKDKFSPPKEVTHDIVREKYRLVSRYDRIGRMADTQEFDNLIFPLSRFSDELIEELQTVAPSQIEIRDQDILIKHLYTERYMTPLNIYLETADDDQIRSAMEEYGNCIKQLAAANIFPGDMPLKNFGVTRHGRVVFYDYDEIATLTECNFRRIPQPRTEQEEMQSGTWYTVAPEDIFPEEFRLFFSGNVKARKMFEKIHSELYELEFWTNLQDKIRNGYVVDVFPYRRAKRFDRGKDSQLEVFAD